MLTFNSIMIWKKTITTGDAGNFAINRQPHF